MIDVNARIVAIGLGIIALSTCRNPLETPPTFDQPVPLETVSSFPSMSGIADRQVQVITSANDWRLAWANVVANYAQPPEPPVVNFDSSAVILAAAGTTNTQLFAFQIAEVRERTSGLFVKAELTWPTCGSLPVMTAPVHIVKIRRVDRLVPLTFTFVNKAGPCV